MLARKIALLCVAALVVCGLFALDAVAGKGGKKPKPPPDPMTNPAWVFDGGRNLFLATSDGADTFKLTSNHRRRGPDVDHPIWSPDGVQIAYLQYPDPDLIFSDLYTIRPDGTNQTFVRSFVLGDPIPATGQSHEFDHLTWTPSGAELVYGSNRTLGGSSRLWVVDVSTGVGTSVVADEMLNKKNVSFSPDLDTATPGYQGKMIYEADTPPYGFDHQNLVVRDATIGASGELLPGANSQVIPRPGAQHCPAWSPDGSYVAFLESETSSGPFFLVKVANASVLSSGDVVLTDHRLLAQEWGSGGPSWSPDSQYVAFSTPANLVYRVRVDGTGLTSVLEGQRPDWNPDWVNDLGP